MIDEENGIMIDIGFGMPQYILRDRLLRICHLKEHMCVLSISLCKFTTLIHFEIDISPFYPQQEIKITFHLVLLADDGIERKYVGIR